MISDIGCRRWREIEILKWLHDGVDNFGDWCIEHHGDPRDFSRSCTSYFLLINQLDILFSTYLDEELDLSELTTPSGVILLQYGSSIKPWPNIAKRQ